MNIEKIFEILRNNTILCYTFNTGVTADSVPPGDSPPLSKGGRYS